MQEAERPGSWWSEPQDNLGASGIRADRSIALCPYLVERELHCWQNRAETGLRLTENTTKQTKKPKKIYILELLGQRQ